MIKKIIYVLILSLFVVLIMQSVKPFGEIDCGDGILNFGEECDDGNSIDLDLCSNSCKIQECKFDLQVVSSPNQVESGEKLKYIISLTNTGTAYCTGGGVELVSNYDENTEFVSAIPEPYINDNEWNFGEVPPGETNNVEIDMILNEDVSCEEIITNNVCVWANELPGWQCESELTDLKCSPESYCGNGVIESSEECDDGNSDNTDSCSNYCKIKRCDDCPVVDYIPRQKIHLHHIRFNYQVYDLISPGAELYVDTIFENVGLCDTKKATIRITIEGLGISKKIGPFYGLDKDDVMKKGTIIEIPKDAEGGVYTARITFRTDDGLIRIKHRDIRVI